METTIENHGHEAFVPLPELKKEFWVILRIDDGNADVEAIAYPRGEVQLDRLEPGEQRVLYCYAFLPDWYRYGNGFWKRVREGRQIRIRGAYRMTSDGMEVTGPWHNVLVMPRAENEITALGSWINAEGRGKLGSFSPGHFGIMFRHTLDREQMHELASDVPSGELGDMFRMGLQFCDLQQSPPNAREAGNRKLVEWLRKQPDVTFQRRPKIVLDKYWLRSLLSVALSLSVAVLTAHSTHGEQVQAPSVQQAAPDDPFAPEGPVAREMKRMREAALFRGIAAESISPNSHSLVQPERPRFSGSGPRIRPTRCVSASDIAGPFENRRSLRAPADVAPRVAEVW